MKRCPHCTAENADEHEVCYHCRELLDAPALNTAVRITDIDMPFGSMVVFMVKWAIAAIPALIILFVIGALLVGLLGGLAALGLS